MKSFKYIILVIVFLHSFIGSLFSQNNNEKNYLFYIRYNNINIRSDAAEVKESIETTTGFFLCLDTTTIFKGDLCVSDTIKELSKIDLLCNELLRAEKRKALIRNREYCIISYVEIVRDGIKKRYYITDKYKILTTKGELLKKNIQILSLIYNL